MLVRQPVPIEVQIPFVTGRSHNEHLILEVAEWNEIDIEFDIKAFVLHIFAYFAPYLIRCRFLISPEVEFESDLFFLFR
ncbi:hypothetical protein D9M71_769620 [compost metagenome]